MVYNQLVFELKAQIESLMETAVSTLILLVSYLTILPFVLGSMAWVALVGTLVVSVPLPCRC